MKKIFLLILAFSLVKAQAQKVEQKSLVGKWQSQTNDKEFLVIKPNMITWYYADGRLDQVQYKLIYDKALNFTKIRTADDRDYTINNPPTKELTLNFVKDGVKTVKYKKVKA